MAKEITCINNIEERDGTIKWRLFYHFPISPQVEDANGTKVAPLSSENIPPEILQFFTQTEMDTLKSFIDNGDRGFAIVQVDQTPGENQGDFINRVKLHWAAVRDNKVQLWREQYLEVGRQVSI